MKPYNVLQNLIKIKYWKVNLYTFRLISCNKLHYDRNVFHLQLNFDTISVWESINKQHIVILYTNRYNLLVLCNTKMYPKNWVTIFNTFSTFSLIKSSNLLNNLQHRMPLHHPLIDSCIRLYSSRNHTI